MIARRVLPLLLAIAACSSAPEELGRARQAIVKGTDSDASQDAVVLLVHYDALSKDGSASCSGTLLTPRLVLTARHCVAVTDESAACGTNPAGGQVYGDHEPSKLFVFAGTQRPDLLGGVTQAARGAEIIDDGATTLCNHDVALLLLDRPIPGAKIAPLRLDGLAQKGEKVTLVGWGITEKTNTPETRQQRTGVTVLGVGPEPPALDAEIVVDEGACSGDSGGPAIAASGAVVGVLSRGGNGTGATGADGCIGGEDIYSSPSKFKDLILQAYAKAGQEPWREGEPNPTLAKNGAACGADAECQSALCDPQGKVCEADCSQAACASGFACTDRGGRKLCVANPADSGGCAVTPRGQGTASARALVLAFALFAIARGRRRS